MYLSPTFKLLTDCSARIESRKRLIGKSSFFLLLLSSAYPSNMAPIATKLHQNAFRTIPDISFFDEKNLFRNFERPFTPRGWLRSAWNFGKTRFRWSPTIHFSAAQTFFATNIFVAKFFFVNGSKKYSAKSLFWRSSAGLQTNVECSSRIHCQNYRCQPSTTLGRGVKRVKTVFCSWDLA